MKRGARVVEARRVLVRACGRGAARARLIVGCLFISICICPKSSYVSNNHAPDTTATYSPPAPDAPSTEAPLAPLLRLISNSARSAVGGGKS